MRFLSVLFLCLTCICLAPASPPAIQWAADSPGFALDASEHPGQPTTPMAQPVDSVPGGRDAGAPAADVAGDSQSDSGKRVLLIGAAAVAVAAIVLLVVFGSSGSSGGSGY